MSTSLEKLNIDLTLSPSPQINATNLKIKGLMKANVKLFDVSPKKLKQDPEDYEFWYAESKKFLRQVN